MAKTSGQSGSPGQSGSRVTDVPGRVGARVSVTDPVPSLAQTKSNTSQIITRRNVHSMEMHFGADSLTLTVTLTLDLFYPKAIGCETVESY